MKEQNQMHSAEEMRNLCGWEKQVSIEDIVEAKLKLRHISWAFMFPRLARFLRRCSECREKGTF